MPVGADGIVVLDNLRAVAHKARGLRGESGVGLDHHLDVFGYQARRHTPDGMTRKIAEGNKLLSGGNRASRPLPSFQTAESS